MKKNKLEWYVLNETHDIHYRSNGIGPFNIFDNWVLEEDVEKHIKAFKKGKLTYDEFKEEVRRSIMWQEWGRCEYEIQVCPWPYDEKKDTIEKIDCYEQVVPNLEALCIYILYKRGVSYERISENKKNSKQTKKDLG